MKFVIQETTKYDNKYTCQACGGSTLGRSIPTEVGCQRREKVVKRGIGLTFEREHRLVQG